MTRRVRSRDDGRRDAGFGPHGDRRSGLRGRWWRGGATSIAALLALAVLACGPSAEDLRVPTADEVEAAYTLEHAFEVAVSGNVAELTVYQQTEQLRRGGSLWARVGPYIFLFSTPTRSLFTDYPGLAAVRVVTRDPSGEEVARATLARQALNDVTWRRALNIAGRARRDGTQRIGLLQDLIRWGEDHTEFQYSDRYGR